MGSAGVRAIVAALLVVLPGAAFAQDAKGGSVLAYDEAERLMAEYQARGHKQSYWVERMSL